MQPVRFRTGAMSRFQGQNFCVHGPTSKERQAPRRCPGRIAGDVTLVRQVTSRSLRAELLLT